MCSVLIPYQRCFLARGLPSTPLMVCFDAQQSLILVASDSSFFSFFLPKRLVPDVNSHGHLQHHEAAALCFALEFQTSCSCV